MKEHYFSWIRNPMTVIALFVGLTEIAFGLAFSKAPENLQTPIVWFLVIFPSLCALCFFLVLFFRPENFYGPHDYRSDKGYLEALSKVTPYQKQETCPGISELPSEHTPPADEPAHESFSGEETEPLAKVEQRAESSINWGNSGNIFWTGHDLMWTIDVLLRGAPRDTIVHGLRQSLHHIRSLGSGGTPIESRLARLKADAERTLENDWTTLERNKYAKEIGAIISHIGQLAGANQQDFESRPRG